MVQWFSARGSTQATTMLPGSFPELRLLMAKGPQRCTRPRQGLARYTNHSAIPRLTSLLWSHILLLEALRQVPLRGAGEGGCSHSTLVPWSSLQGAGHLTFRKRHVGGRAQRPGGHAWHAEAPRSLPAPSWLSGHL